MKEGFNKGEDHGVTPRGDHVWTPTAAQPFTTISLGRHKRQIGRAYVDFWESGKMMKENCQWWMWLVPGLNGACVIRAIYGYQGAE